MPETDEKYFIPICLYPHTAYRTNNGVAALFEKYDLASHDHLIVVADRLLALDYLVTGRYWSESAIFDKARREAAQVFNLVKRVSHKFGTGERGRLVYWDEIAETPKYRDFAARLKDEFLKEQLLASALDQFVGRRVERFGLGAAPGRERDYEQEYLLSEVCMSVFCTEALGYPVEIWERPPPPGAPDPLKLLYESKRDVVEKAAGRPPVRVLRFLFEPPPE